MDQHNGILWFSFFAFSNYNALAQDNFPTVSVDGPAADGDTSFSFYIDPPSGNYSGLFRFQVSPEATKEMEGREILGRGDAFVFNSYKFLANLITYIRRESSNGAEPILPLHPSPLNNLGKRCQVPSGAVDIMRGFILGKYYENQLGLNSPLMARFVNPCTPAGFLPLLLCIGPVESDGSIQRGTCTCSVQTPDSRWTTYTYREIKGPPGTPEAGKAVSCVGNVGSVCHNPYLTCDQDQLCESGITHIAATFCGGELAGLAKGFGGGISITEEQQREVLRRRQFTTALELDSYLIRVSNSLDVIGRDCDPKYWTWATHAVIPVIKLVNSTDANFPIFDPDNFRTAQSIPILAALAQYHLAAVLKGYNILDRENITGNYDERKWQLTVKRADFYIGGDPCLNEFPRTVCIQKPNDPERGVCQCATKEVTGSHSFDYVKEYDQCVGEEGVVCTTVRGSGDHVCAQGLVCESPPNHVVDPGIRERIPGPLAHHAIKICMKSLLPDTGIRDGDTNDSVTTTVDLFTALTLWCFQIILVNTYKPN